MAAIIQRTFGTDGLQNGLSLGNEVFTRKMLWANNWLQIRLGMLYAITPNGVSTITGTREVIGIGSTTNQNQTYNTTTTLNFVGAMINHTSESTGQDLLFNAATNPYYNQVTVNGDAIFRVNNSSTLSAFGGGGIMHIPTTGGAAQRRGIVMLDIWRPGAFGGNATQWTFLLRGDSAAAAQVDKSFYQFQNVMNSSSTGATVAFPAFTLNSPASVLINTTISEVGRPLDTVSIFWNKALFPLEIYDVSIIRFQ